MSGKVLSTVAVTCLALGLLVGYGVSALEASTVRNKVSDLESQIIVLQGQLEKLRNSSLNLQQATDTVILGVYFSPRGGGEKQVIRWIDRANSTVHVLIYSFTDDAIGDAVLRAYQRGVEVKIVLEKTQVSKYSEYWRLRAAGVPARNDTNPSLMHDKVAVIDGSIVLTGSFNWSDAAENDNNENLVVLRGSNLAREYENEFQKIWEAGR
jgi:phosphatidylserine/phosphatidylglycerophosphate/cardiolipin synthase-like enzyme